ncbi:RNA polymerase sigma factor SigV, partial [Hungatella hathewayi DSM 13479]
MQHSMPVKGDRGRTMEHDHYDIVVNYIIANQKKFYRLAYTYVRNENDALDIVQNAIYSALEHYGSIREISYIKTWFYRVL